MNLRSSLNSRSSLGKAAIVTCSLALTGAYIYYRSGADWFSWSSPDANAQQAQVLPLGSLGNETGQVQLEKIVLIGGSKSNRIFTLHDARAASCAATHGRGGNRR